MYKVQIYKDGVPIPDDITWKSEEQAQVLKVALEFYFKTQALTGYTCCVELVEQQPK